MEDNIVPFGPRSNDLKLERWTLKGIVAEYILKHGSCDKPTHRLLYREYYLRDPWFEVWFSVGNENIGLFIHDPALTEHRTLQLTDGLVIRSEAPELNTTGYRKVSRALYKALWRVFHEPE